MRYFLHMFYVSAVMALFTAPVLAQNDKTSSATWVDDDFRDGTNQYKILMKEVPEGQLPRTLYENGTLRTCTADNWVSGFYPGTLLYLYEATKDQSLLQEAEKRLVLLDSQQYNRNTHDLGFMMNCSFGNAYRITHNDKYKQILLNSARSLSTRFNPKVGCIRSWGKSDDSTQFRVIIDNMMNLELLMWAWKETGDNAFYKIATTHANTTMVNHFRPDHSSYHLVIYDPLTGGVIKKQTVQGAADSSAWARGQSWGLYGYTMMYRYTKDKRYLQQANSIARFILTNPNLPEDKIPYWDYNAPGIPNTYRDVSAGSLIASALLELSGYSDKKSAKLYRQVAETILKNLSSPAYKAAPGENGGFILKHSVGSLPGKSEIDVPLTYADYYFVEALGRYKKSK